MSDDDTPDDSLSSSDSADDDDAQYSERAESVADRIDRINRNAFQRIVCRRLVERSEYASR